MLLYREQHILPELGLVDLPVTTGPMPIVRRIA